MIHKLLSACVAWRRPLARGPFLVAFLILFGLSYNLERLLAEGGFHFQWDFFRYMSPLSGLISLFENAEGDCGAQIGMLALSLFSSYFGLLLVVRRLVSLALPAWIGILFFLPVINALFLIPLALLPGKEADTGDLSEAGSEQPRPAPTWLERIIPRHPLGTAFLAVVLTLLLGVSFTLLAVTAFREYGWTLFVGLPFMLGLLTVLIDGYLQKRSLWRCLWISWLATLLLAVGLIVAAVEGLICVLMAAPIAWVCASLGALLGYLIQARLYPRTATANLVLGLVLAMPLLMGMETRDRLTPTVYSVTTTQEIAAPREVVWRHVVAFSELPPPEEELFLLGIAYPLRAEIQGEGVGAVRYCIFSTGPFVEPIEVWDAPRHLKFSVAAQPPIMKEFSPYPNLQPPHVDDYLQSQQGAFRLTPLPNGHTLLAGTTWYTHAIWPQAYWRLWSDAVIHKIHQRVLRHIQSEAEQDVA